MKCEDVIVPTILVMGRRLQKVTYVDFCLFDFTLADLTLGKLSSKCLESSTTPPIDSALPIHSAQLTPLHSQFSVPLTILHTPIDSTLPIHSTPLTPRR